MGTKKSPRNPRRHALSKGAVGEAELLGRARALIAEARRHRVKGFQAAQFTLDRLEEGLTYLIGFALQYNPDEKSLSAVLAKGMATIAANLQDHRKALQ